jgi:tungstate transport system substrate-binding protein
MKRREIALALAAASLGTALAQPARRIDPLRFGVDAALARAGAGARLQRAFSAQTGLSISVSQGPSAALLDALESGELDATLTFAPDIEAHLEQQGLAHDRHTLAEFEFVLAGPVDRGRDPARVSGTKDVAAALTLIAAGTLPYLAHGGGSGTHLLEQSLWRAAHAAPLAPWSRALTDGERDELAVAAQERRYVVTDRARWSGGGVGGLAALVQGDARLRVPVQVLRPFRHQHPSGKLFVQWLASPRGQQAIAGPGLHALPQG